MGNVLETNIVEKKIDNVISDKGIRDNLVRHTEVLEKVKDLILMPFTDEVSIEEVAEYYEVTKRNIGTLYKNNREEIDLDGTRVLPSNFYEENEKEKDLNEKEKHFPFVQRTKSSAIYTFTNGEVISIGNRGIRVFSKRAVLRIGMLLRNSEIAKKVRTELLNIEENSTAEVKLKSITEEEILLLDIGKAYASGDIDELMKATTIYNDFQYRHRKQLEDKNNSLKTDNKMLARENLEWEPRSILNKGIRHLSKETGEPYGKLWNTLYGMVKYKHHIDVKARAKRDYIKQIKENEWEYFLEQFASMCEAYGYSADEIINKISME